MFLSNYLEWNLSLIQPPMTFRISSIVIFGENMNNKYVIVPFTDISNFWGGKLFATPLYFNLSFFQYFKEIK